MKYKATLEFERRSEQLPDGFPIPRQGEAVLAAHGGMYIVDRVVYYPSTGKILIHLR